MRELLSRRGAGERPRLLDGAIGTELIARGLDLAIEPPEAWTLRRPEVLDDLHARYLAAGAEVIQTNTFGASRPRLLRADLHGEIGRINREAVRLARASGARWVVASLGPTGIEPFGDGAGARIEEAWAEQMAHLAAAGIDGLHGETLCHPVEAAAFVRAARAVAPRLPVLVSTTVALGDLGFQTPWGIPLLKMADAALEAGADAVGVNCSIEARKLIGAVRALRQAFEVPVLAQPQGGEPSVGCRGEQRGDTPERFARDCVRLVEAGADAIGGCCGAGPDYIGALRRALDERTLGDGSGLDERDFADEGDSVEEPSDDDDDG